MVCRFFFFAELTFTSHLKIFFALSSAQLSGVKVTWSVTTSSRHKEITTYYLTLPLPPPLQASKYSHFLPVVHGVHCTVLYCTVMFCLDFDFRIQWIFREKFSAYSMYEQIFIYPETNKEIKLFVSFYDFYHTLCLLISLFVPVPTVSYWKFQL